MDQFPTTDLDILEISENLRWFRKTRGMTLRNVSIKSGLSISFLSDLERGKTNPSINTIQKLVNIYQSPISVEFRPNNAKS